MLVEREALLEHAPADAMRSVCSLMQQHLLELFEDHDSLVLERVVYEQRALAQPLHIALQLGYRQKTSTTT